MLVKSPARGPVTAPVALTKGGGNPLKLGLHRQVDHSQT